MSVNYYKLGDYHVQGNSNVKRAWTVVNEAVVPSGELCVRDGDNQFAPVTDLTKSVFGVASAYTESKDAQTVVEQGLRVAVKTSVPIGDTALVKLGDYVIADPAAPSLVKNVDTLTAGDYVIGTVAKAGVHLAKSEEHMATGALNNCLLVDLGTFGRVS